MKKYSSVVALAAILVAGACDQVASPLAEDGGGVTHVVVTQGIAAPAYVARPFIPANSDLGAPAASLGGSVSTAVPLKASSCAGNQQSIVVTYSVTGRQDNPASFAVNTTFEFDGTSWTGSDPTTVNVPARAAGDPATSRLVGVTLINGSAASSGTSSFTILPANVVTSSPAALSVADGAVTIHVAFGGCAIANTAPVLVLPTDITTEATSAAGASVNFAVTASDAQDGDLTSAVVCMPASGDVFPLGETTVSCSVTDNGGLSAQGSFKINVVDTTPPAVTGMPSVPQPVIAESINGATVNFSSVVGSDIVDGNTTIVCTRSDASAVSLAAVTFPIGANTVVTCSSTDDAGNTGSASVTIEVTLDVGASVGFVTPLRMAAPFSAHKRGSAVPHKFPAPKYADGTPATDLASGLNLALQHFGGVPSGLTDVTDVPGAGSTAWRYDADDGHYIFNVKSLTSWSEGQWRTAVSYAGIVLAQTEFALKK